MITRETLEQKLTAMRTQYVQFLANTHATQGAIQLLEQLLAELDAASAPKTA